MKKPTFIELICTTVIILVLVAPFANSRELPASRARQIKTDTTNFDNNLNSTHTTVQSALEALDEISGAGGNGTPAGSGSEVQLRLNASTFQAADGSSWNDTTQTVTLANLTVSGTTESGTLTEGGIAVLNNDEMDASSELAAIIDDETGSGLVVFNVNPTFEDITLNAAGVKISDDADGAITFLGLGDGADEDLTLNFDDTADKIVFSSSTSAGLDFGSMAVDCDSNTVTLSTVSGAIDAGGATSLEAPNSASVTVDAAGKFGVDTTQGQWQFHDNTGAVVATKYLPFKTGWENATTADNITVGTMPVDFEIINVNCWCNSGTWNITISDTSGNDLETISCDDDGAADDGSIVNGTFTANELMKLNTVAISNATAKVGALIWCKETIK